MRFRPFKAFRTRFAGAVALDPLGLLAGLQRSEDMREAGKRTVCEDCSGRVLRLRAAAGGHVLVDEPRDGQVARGPAVIVGEDGLARPQREGHAPLDGQRAFVLHSSTCKVLAADARDAAIARMEARREGAAVGA
jgi:hypothetical protein